MSAGPSVSNMADGRKKELPSFWIPSLTPAAAATKVSKPVGGQICLWCASVFECTDCFLWMLACFVIHVCRDAIHTHTLTLIHMRMHVRTHIRTFAHTHARTHPHTHTHTYMEPDTYTHTCMGVYTLKHIHKLTHTENIAYDITSRMVVCIQFLHKAWKTVNTMEYWNENLQVRKNSGILGGMGGGGGGEGAGVVHVFFSEKSLKNEEILTLR